MDDEVEEGVDLTVPKASILYCDLSVMVIGEGALVETRERIDITCHVICNSIINVPFI